MLHLPPQRVTAPELTPVTLAAARQHLAVDHDEHDGRIQLAIDAATAHLDGYSGILGRALVRQVRRESFGFWPAGRCVPLALAPVLSVTSVACRTAAGEIVTLPETAYRVLAEASDPKLLIGMSADLPVLECAPDAVTVTYEAGYGDPDKVPAPLRAAILMMVGDQYRFTETATLGAAAAVPMSVTVDRLVAPFRRLRVS